MPRLPPLALLLVLLPLLGALGCSPPTPFTELETRPSGRYGQTLRWQAHATADGPEHRVRVGFDVDPAQLMVWAKKTRPYYASIVVAAEGPDGARQEATVLLEVTTRRKVGEDKAAGTVQVTYAAAGDPLANGFWRVAAKDAVIFTPSEGSWTLSATLRTPSNADKRAVRAIRVLRLELIGRDSPGLLREWGELDPLPGD